MREILFRGKRKDNGEWVEGFLSQSRGLDKKLHLCIDFEEKGVMCSSIIDPETVGQYTGMMDKNGTKIFEGDIVKVEDDVGDTDFSDGGIGEVSFENGSWYIFGEPNNSLYYLAKWYYVSVIGNIYDTPELLKGD